MFEFNYNLTDNDYITFNMHYLFHTKFGKKTSQTLRLVIPLCCFSIFFLLLSEEIFSLIALTIVLIIGALWLIFFKKIMKYNTIRLIRKMKKSGRPPYSENGALIFEDNCIHDCNPLLESKTSYSLIENIYMTDEALYIYYRAAAAYILPYRCIKNQATFNAFVDFLQAKTNKQVINVGTKK